MGLRTLLGLKKRKNLPAPLSAVPRHQVVFLHIPKTAGTTLHTMLVDRFPQSMICPERFNDLARFSADELANYRLFSGHFDWDVVALIPGEKSVVTILREPHERLVSFYYFSRAHTWEQIQKSGFTEMALAKNLSLLDFIRCDNPRVRHHVDNYMTRALVGNRNYSEMRPTVAVELALDRLRSMTAVGFFDNLQDGLRLILQRLSFDAPSEIPHRMGPEDLARNPGIERVERPAPLTDAERAELDRVTQLDRAVLEAARVMYRSASGA